MAGNYDNSASFYDGLSGLVFGDALLKAQYYLLPHIPLNTKTLIIGGGTGRILEAISAIHPSGLSISYVEISAKMTAIARKKDAGENKVEFINDAIEKVNLPNDFDVVITSFLFDNYTQQNLPATFNRIHSMLKPGGLWLNTDFQLTGKWWQYLMLKSMLLFFKVLCGVESWRLPDTHGQFNRHGYHITDEKTFFGDFILTRVYRK